MSKVVSLLASVAASAFVLTTSTAWAFDDCPPGSRQKTEEGFTWCEPSVCSMDAQCGANEVCKPVPLCVQIGNVASDASTRPDAGQRLVATQRCGIDKACSPTTVCQEGNRCISRTIAEKMGLVQPAGPKVFTASSSSPAYAKKEGSRCSVTSVGAPTASEASNGALLALAAASVAPAIRRLRRSRRA